MRRTGTDITKTRFSKPILWVTFILYCILLSYTISHHELWGDEIHSWNIVKASANFSDLISNTRYEGHPLVWYMILWPISKFTHDVAYIQVAQLIIATLAVFLIVFFSPFPLIARVLTPFGYFFLFEYGVLSRNYAIGVLFALCICVFLRKNFRGKIILYYIVLFLLSNTHLIAFLLACSLHLYFLMLNMEKKKKPVTIVLHVITGILILLPALFFIFPPSDSQLNTHFWLSKWDINHQFALLIQPLLRAFVPVPAWWRYNFWDTQFLLELESRYSFVKFITVSVLIVLFGMLFYIFRPEKKCLTLFSANLLLSFIVSVIMPLNAQRYTGFIFVGFITAYWLYCAETPANGIREKLVNMLLLIQLAGSFFAVIKDIQLPFSNADKVAELVKEVPQNEKIVTDYWALNSLVAFMDKPFYVLEMHKEMSFLKWDTELKTMTETPGLYSKGVKYFFQKEGIQQAYIISIHSPKNISNLDPLLFKQYKTILIDKREGAIEKGGNLYLYQISTF